MDEYEELSLVMAGAAFALSIISFAWQVFLQRQNSRLQKITAELMNKQLFQIKQAEKSRNRTEIVVGLYEERPTPKFYIINKGASTARNVNFSLVLDDPKLSPLEDSELEQKLPIPMMESGDQVKLIAAITGENSLSYSGILKWVNADGSNEEKEFHVSLL